MYKISVYAHKHSKHHCSTTQVRFSPMSSPTILILGYARHGKDTVADLLQKQFGIKYTSTSLCISNILTFSVLQNKYQYATAEECYADRHQHREEWFSTIRKYNQNDKTKLARSVLQLSDCYVGMRDKEAVIECKRKNVFDIVVWVDAKKRLPRESLSSCTVTPNLADVIVDNNGTPEMLLQEVDKLGSFINSHKCRS